MNLPLFLDLLNTYSISSREDNIRSYFKTYLKEYPEYKLVGDKIGSLFALKKSANKKALNVVIGAHFDEVGFIVSKINKDGTLNIIPVGGINYHVLYNKEILLINDLGEEIPGVISIPLNSLDDLHWPKKVSAMKLDLGLKYEDIEKHHISLDNVVVYPKNAKLSINKKMIISKALDNRLGLGVIMEVIKNLSSKELDYNLYLGAHAQEEVGLRGSRVFANTIKADLFIAIDCSPIDDINTIHPEFRLGAGPMMRYYDRGTLLKTKLRDYLKTKFNTSDIQTYFAVGGTDAISYYTENGGAISTSLLIPGRYLHSPAGIASISDIEKTISILSEFLANINNQELLKLKDIYTNGQ